MGTFKALDPAEVCSVPESMVRAVRTSVLMITEMTIIFAPRR